MIVWSLTKAASPTPDHIRFVNSIRLDHLSGCAKHSDMLEL